MTKITLRDGVFDLKVGDMVYINTGNMAMSDTLPITKIGKKYVYVKQYRSDLKFDINDGLEYHGPNDCGTKSECYSSKAGFDEIVDLHRKVRLVEAKVKHLDTYNISPNREIINKLYDILIKE